MPLRRLLAAAPLSLTLVAAVTPTRGARRSSLLTRQGVDALGAIVGRWQSDTTAGMWAVSDCAWSPDRDAVICEQAITAPDGPHWTAGIHGRSVRVGR